MPAWPRDALAILANGDRIRGTVIGGDADIVRFEAAARGTGKPAWTVPITTLAAIWTTGAPAETPPDPMDYLWAAGPKRRDAVLLRNGDVVRGTVTAFAASPAAILVAAGGTGPTIIVPLDRAAAVAFDPKLARVRKVKGIYARLVTTDGSRISLSAASCDGARLRGTTLFGGAVDVPLDEVVALDWLQSKATYLSDLKPKRAVVDAYNGVTWPWAANRTVRGNPLRLAGPHGEQTFDRGLGTHSRTTLTYDLAGKFRRFEAQIGLDPETGRRGAADVRVVVDGKDVPVEGLAPLTSAIPREVSVDVSGAKELTLIVDYGPGGDVQDDVNWCDARLVE
ncbi:carbohydrate-binding protein [Fimbriiglobus ruber]|uniref:Carbohydrate-binding protein n=1 Tax=Fimbriiglobus ruber TaxID=1908690 RepID=A0A225E8G0_9BACT|nr:carbohydrate-binding protein [Fimbriiglobus ruber]